MTPLDAMKQAIEALEHSRTYADVDNAITNLRAAIEQLEKLEPVAFVTDSGYGAVLISNHGLDDGTPLYSLEGLLK